MKKLPQKPSTLLAAALGLSAFLGLAHIAPADDSAAKPYKILATTQIPAAGRIDYVTADSVNRRVYVACGSARRPDDRAVVAAQGWNTAPHHAASDHDSELGPQPSDPPPCDLVRLSPPEQSPGSRNV